MPTRPFFGVLAFAATLLAMLLAPGIAFADSIDGAWCHDKQGRMMINGPAIVTPAGTRTQGDYGRHSFSYVVPTGEPGAGATVSMRLVSEEAVQVRVGQGSVDTWLRCGPPVS